MHRMCCLDLAYVGSGRLDGLFYNKINFWDIAAGILIVKERVVLQMIFQIMIIIVSILEHPAAVFTQK